MAKVRAGDRSKTKKRTGSDKYPMETGAQIASAIKLRHHARGGPSASAVLSRASSAVSRLLKAKKISLATAKTLRGKISEARATDK